MDAPQVAIGDTTHTLRSFTAFKASLAGEIIANASSEVKELMQKSSDFRREYAKNTITITRGLNIAREYGWPDEAFDAEGKLELPDQPGQMEMIGFVFPEAFKLARDEVMKILALALVENRDLELADDEERVDALLTERGKQLLRTASMQELIRLAGAVAELVQTELDQVQDDLGKIRAVLERRFGRASESSDPGPLPSTTSSTSSEATTAGPVDTPSMEHAGATS